MTATEANDVIDDPALSRPRKVLQRLDESSNAFFYAETKDNHRQLYYEVLDSAISGLSDRFEPDATAVHLTNIENFLIGQREVLTILLALTKTMLIGRDCLWIEIYSLAERCQQDNRWRALMM